MVGRSNGATFRFQKSKWRLTAIFDIQSGHNFATGLEIDVMFGFRVGFPAELSFLPYIGLHTRTAVARNPCVSWTFLSSSARLPVFSASVAITSQLQKRLNYAVR